MSKTPIKTEETLEQRDPAAVIRWGRGRLGGSSKLIYLAQRARSQGRQVLLRDGDLKSSTLYGYYPDACTRPPSENIADFKQWVMDDFDEMAEDRVSRIYDVSGGDRVLQELLQDLNLPTFCVSFGFRLTWLCMLGPDEEDFRHVRAALDAGDLNPGNMLLVLNEGVIRQNQNAASAFDAIIEHPDFRAMLKNGAKTLYWNRLPGMKGLLDAKLDFFDVAAQRPDANGIKPKATMAHMTKGWLAEAEVQHAKSQTQAWVP